MRYLTERQAEDIAPLAGLDSEARARVLADAAQVYRYISANPWISDGDLRVWAEAHGATPDRLNAALQVLISSGKLVDLDTPADESALPRLDLSALTIAILDGLIAKAIEAKPELEPPASDATKDQKVLWLQQNTRL